MRMGGRAGLLLLHRVSRRPVPLERNVLNETSTAVSRAYYSNNALYANVYHHGHGRYVCIYLNEYIAFLLSGIKIKMVHNILETNIGKKLKYHIFIHIRNEFQKTFFLTFYGNGFTLTCFYTVGLYGEVVLRFSQ